MKDYRQLIGELLRAVEIRSPTSYAWFGVLNVVVSPETQAAMSPQDARIYLRYALKNRLYADFYCPGTARAPREHYGAQVTSTSSFLRRLSDANAGGGSSSGGWKYSRHEGETLVMERHGLQVWVDPAEVVTNTLSAEEGGPIAVRMPKELFRLSPGFYMALGDRDLSEEAPESQLRFYWNLDARAAALLVNLVTTRLNPRGIAFRLKVVDSETGYSRTDAGVLYVRREDQTIVEELIEDIYRQLNPPLKSRTPAFSMEVAPGLGFAENPVDPNESFGTARCDLLAEALLRAQEQQAADGSERLRIVESCFAEAAVDFDAPYLNAHSGSKPPAAYR